MKEPNEPKEPIPNFYQDLLVYEVAKVIDVGDKYRVEYITQSTIPWVTNRETNKTNDSINVYLPLNNFAAELINTNLLKGKEVYILKDWMDGSNEVLVTSIQINPIMDLESYKRRAIGFIKSFINPQMAQVHASVIYGFTSLNNKFLINGFVFSEKTKSLQYIKVMDLAEDVEETNPELSEELLEDLEKYIEYNDILSRTNFIWNESEKYIDKIYNVNSVGESKDSEYQAKTQIDNIAKEFQQKIRTLNNLK